MSSLTVAVRPAGAEGEPKAGAGGETTAAGAAAGGKDTPGLDQVDANYKRGWLIIRGGD